MDVRSAVPLARPRPRGGSWMLTAAPRRWESCSHHRRRLRRRPGTRGASPTVHPAGPVVAPHPALPPAPVAVPPSPPLRRRRGSAAPMPAPAEAAPPPLPPRPCSTAHTSGSAPAAPCGTCAAAPAPVPRRVTGWSSSRRSGRRHGSWSAGRADPTYETFTLQIRRGWWWTFRTRACDSQRSLRGLPR